MKPQFSESTLPRVFPDSIKVKTNTFTSNGTQVMTSAQKVFERRPSHVMESRWALYVNIRRLAVLVEDMGKLPRVSLREAKIEWISTLDPDRPDELTLFKPCAYLIRFTPNIEVGSHTLYTYKFISEDEDLDPYYYFGFRHEAPAPVVPWSGCTVTGIEMPPELFLSVQEGMKQAEEALITYLFRHGYE
jgi:hypothetical protein